MTLLPADLPWRGFGMGRVHALGVTEVAMGHASYAGQPYQAVLSALHEQAGYLRGHRSELRLPLPDAPDQAQAVVASYVHAYATADGATRGFALLEDETGIATAQDVPGTRTFRDGSELTRDRRVADDTGVPYDTLDLTFRDGTLVAGVTLVLFRWDQAATAVAVPSGGPDLDVATLEALAEVLGRNLEEMRATGGPALSTAALHLTGDGVVPDFAGYVRLGGLTVPHVAETPEALAERSAGYGAALDVYEVGLAVDPAFYVARLYRFADSDGASAWLAEGGQPLAEPPYVDVTALSDPPDVGDEARALSYGFELGEAGTARGHLVYVRVGSVVARVQVDAVPGSSRAAVEELGRAQAECLDSPDPCVPVAVPADLVEGAGMATEPLAPEPAEERTEPTADPTA